MSLDLQPLTDNIDITTDYANTDRRFWLSVFVQTDRSCPPWVTCHTTSDRLDQPSLSHLSPII